MRWNWVADLPFGRGKWLGGNASGLLNVSVVGKSGAGNGTGNAGVIVQSGARISATNGALNVAGTRIGTGDQAIGVLVSGANSSIDSVGNGAMTGQ